MVEQHSYRLLIVGHEGAVRVFLGPLVVNPGIIGRWRGTAQVT